MALSSMTGFARLDGELGEARWTFELKSVNGRGLEPRFRLPPGLDFLEQDFRKLLADRFSRGSFTVFLALKGPAIEGGFAVNREALKRAIKLVEEVGIAVDCERPRPEGILSLKGVIEPESGLDDEDARARLAGGLKEGFAATADLLAAARRQEGAALAAAIENRFLEIERLTLAARASAEASPEMIRNRIAEQLRDLLAGAVPEERLAEEAAMLALRADIREELDRLSAHVAAGRSLLADEAAAGRRLDFLTQELNREANTLCSKAQDMALKRIGLDLKTAIDQMREQVQNVE